MKASSKNDYGFRKFNSLKPFFKTIYYGKLLIPDAEKEQNSFNEELEDLKTMTQKLRIISKLKAELLKMQRIFMREEK